MAAGRGDRQGETPAEKPAAAKKPAAKKPPREKSRSRERPTAEKPTVEAEERTAAEKKPRRKRPPRSESDAEQRAAAEKQRRREKRRQSERRRSPATLRRRKSAGEGRRPRRKPAPKAAPRAAAGVKPTSRRRVVQAHARYVRTSARKARMVCGHIRGKSIQEARAILAFTSREVARDWSKLLESAVANAESNHELLEDDLIVREAYADEGPTIKRFRPRAMGRATPIRKRTSHLTITLSPRP